MTSFTLTTCVGCILVLIGFLRLLAAVYGAKAKKIEVHEREYLASFEMKRCKVLGKDVRTLENKEN